MPTDGVNKKRRRFLVATTSVVGAVGAGFAAVPFISSWKPSARAKAVGAPVQVPLRRSEQTLNMLDEVADDLRDPASLESDQPEYASNEARALRDEYLVVNMHCTHLGCIPQLIPEVGSQPFEENWKGGFYCPCHKSKFDLAGRVYKGVPAPTNLKVPPYSYLDDETLIIGVSPEGAV